MDVLVCAALSLGEVQLTNSLSNTNSDNPQLFSFAAILFLGQYMLLKFYRVFLFHRYFSPFRHLPGPKVSQPGIHELEQYMPASG